VATYDDAVANYLAHLEHVNRASPHTLRNYARDLSQLREFLADKKHRALADLAKLDVIALRGFLADRHRQDATVSVLRKMSAIRGFLKHSKREKLIAESPAALLDSPKRPKSIPRTVSVDEAAALCQAPEGKLSARDRAVVEFLYGAGVRVSELCNLDLADVDLAGKWARVMARDAKSAWCRFTTSAVAPSKPG